MGYQFNNNVQANPYLDKAFGYFDDLWAKSKALEGETYNKEPALQDFRDSRAQGLKETEATAGGRGFAPGTGMSLAQKANYGNASLQGEQELAGNLWNAGLNQRTQLMGQMAQILGGMSGTGSAIAGNQLGVMNAMTDQARFGLDAWYKTNMLPIEMEKAKSGLVTNQIQAMNALAGLL